MKIAYLGYDVLYPCLLALESAGCTVMELFTCKTDNVYEFNTKEYRKEREDGEETIFNMVNGMLGCMYLSGRIDEADENNQKLIKQGVETYKKIRKYIPNCNISADIIVGFPGETEDDFLDTVDIVYLKIQNN